MAGRRSGTSSASEAIRRRQRAYYAPLLRFLSAQTGPPFRVEIPFTSSHWESYAVATRFPLARGWERQLDIKYNHLFYGGRLDAATYDAWLHSLAVRYVAIADTSLDYSAHVEARLIDRGLPYLKLVMRSTHWRVYAVADPTPIVSGAATLTALGPNSVTIDARRAGTALVRVRYSPYWALGEGSAASAQAGQFTNCECGTPGTDEARDPVLARPDRRRLAAMQLSPGTGTIPASVGCTAVSCALGYVISRRGSYRAAGSMCSVR